MSGHKACKPDAPKCVKKNRVSALMKSVDRDQSEKWRPTIVREIGRAPSNFYMLQCIQREQRKNQEQGNIYKDLSVRSCAESVCAQCACVKCSCDFQCLYPPTSMVGACVVCAETM